MSRQAKKQDCQQERPSSPHDGSGTDDDIRSNKDDDDDWSEDCVEHSANHADIRHAPNNAQVPIADDMGNDYNNTGAPMSLIVSEQHSDNNQENVTREANFVEAKDDDREEGHLTSLRENTFKQASKLHKSMPLGQSCAHAISQKDQGGFELQIPSKENPFDARIVEPGIIPSEQNKPTEKVTGRREDIKELRKLEERKHDKRSSIPAQRGARGREAYIVAVGEDSGHMTNTTAQGRGGSVEFVLVDDRSRTARKRLSEAELVHRIVGINEYFEDDGDPTNENDEESLSHVLPGPSAFNLAETQVTTIRDGTEEGGHRHSGVHKAVVVIFVTVLVAVTCAVVPVLVPPKPAAECDLHHLQGCGKEIMLAKQASMGTIPLSIGLAQTATHLDLSENAISGSLPSELGLLTGLTYLDVAYNSLTGTLPTEIGLLTQLMQMRVRDNMFAGIIPSELGAMTGLTGLHFDWNFLTGPIPSEIGLLNNLKHLHLGSNLVSGTIPTEIGLLDDLQNWTLISSFVTGTMPTELGLLSNMADLQLLWNNRLTGTIPTEMGSLSNLKMLHLTASPLSGTFPTEMGFLSSLADLILAVGLIGTIPTEIGFLSNLQRWTIKTHSSGTIPTEIGLLSNLTTLQLISSGLKGNVPTEMGLLTNLVRWHLDCDSEVEYSSCRTDLDVKCPDCLLSDPLYLN